MPRYLAFAEARDLNVLGDFAGGTIDRLGKLLFFRDDIELDLALGQALHSQFHGRFVPFITPAHLGG